MNNGTLNIIVSHKPVIAELWGGGGGVDRKKASINDKTPPLTHNRKGLHSISNKSLQRGSVLKKPFFTL